MLVKFSYSCHRIGCKNPEFYSYSEKGLDVLIRVHEMEHDQETRDNIKKFDEALKTKPIKNYNKLELTWADIIFLKTRNIALDEDMLWEGYKDKYA